MHIFLSYLKPSSFHIVIIALLSVLNVIGALYIPTLTAVIINEGVLQGNLDFITNSSITLILAAFLTGVTAIISVYFSARVSANLGYSLRQDLLQSIQDFSLQDFNYFGTGTLMMRSTRDVEKIQNVLNDSLSMVLPTPLMILGGLGLTFYKNWQLGLVILLVMVLMLLGMALVQQKALPVIKKVQIQLDYITDLVRDHIVGMAVIRAFNRSLYEISREQAAFTKTASLARTQHQTFAIGLPMILILFNMSTIAILWLGGYNVSSGNMMIGDIMAIIEYANLILMNLLMAVFTLIDIPEALICYGRITELFKHDKLQNSFTNTSEYEVSDTSNIPILEFRHVTFRYAQAEMPVLKDISFTLQAGEKLAIMGDIGSGKSTILNLIPRLFDVASGDILFKGKSIYAWPVETLRAYIGYVPQKAYLFTGTIETNLRYGSLTPLSWDEIKYACKLTQSAEFIESFQLGYQTELVQGGTNLSGGQRQRLAMTRALLRKPELLIFDDSFSALDGTTEHLVRHALDEELLHLPTRAFISVEQKVSAARQADKILVISEGEVAGYGTHAELVEKSEIYRQILASQEVAL